MECVLGTRGYLQISISSFHVTFCPVFGGPAPDMDIVQHANADPKDLKKGF